jgi:hypothetical protein
MAAEPAAAPFSAGVEVLPEAGAGGDPGPRLELSADQRRLREVARAFVDERVAPRAGEWDRAEALPPEIVDALRERGWLGSLLPRAVGGGGLDPIAYGLLTEELGRGCSSVRSLLTVHDMVGEAVRRWGSRELRTELLPRIAAAERLAAFALSEPEVGSDAQSVRTEARRDGDGWVLDGVKKWVTFGRIADLFLVVARSPEGVAAFLVDADAPGLSRTPIRGLVGTRAALLAELRLEGCRVPGSRLVGRPGFGFSHVASTALDLGRYSVAWGAVGIARACLEACLDYTGRREQFGVPLRDHQLVRARLTDMIVGVRAARLLCLSAGCLRRAGDPSATAETLAAKYLASTTATRVAADAVQLHGANGLTEAYPVARWLRDARVTEVIEGSTQIQQLLIPKYPVREL